MQHDFFFDGNSKKIAWTIKTQNRTAEQQREHADMYLNKVTDLQSKYIALHVGLFWGIGRFIIKNEDDIIVYIDNLTIFEHLSNKKEVIDRFIKTRTNFITKFIEQRKLNIEFVFIPPEKNLSSKLIESKGA